MDDESLWLGELYREAGPHLLQYFVRRCSDVHMAEDLLQETFAAALRNPGRLRQAASARAYLFGIARNLTVTAFRHRRETEPVPANLAVESTPPDANLALMREAIDGLKPDFREVLELRLQHELSYDEISEALGIPVGTVRSRLHNAVNELRRVLRGRKTDLTT